MKVRNRKRVPRPARLRWLRALLKAEAKSEPRSAPARSEPPVNVRPTQRAPRTPLSYLVALSLLTVIVAGAFVYHLNVRFQGVWLGYETSRARADRARLLVERRELRTELASLKSPARVGREAREKLGMETPEHSRIIPVGKKVSSVLAAGRAR